MKSARLVVSPTGSFRVFNISPGEYTISVRLMTPKTDASEPYYAFGTATVNVPPLAPEEIDKPVDLGAVHLDMAYPAPGHRMPPVSFELLDGSVLDMASLKGRPVLLTLWLPVGSIPEPLASRIRDHARQVGSAMRTYGNNPRLKTVNLFVPRSQPAIEELKAFLSEYGISSSYTAAKVHGTSATISALMQSGLPCTVLISPDGTILSVRSPFVNRPGTIESDIAAALAP
jgi:hypothetical protein